MKKIISILLLLCMLLGMCACSGEPVAPTLDPSIFNPTGPLYDRDSYSVSDDVALQNHDKVVAQVGSVAITNGFLQFAYWSDYFTYLDERGSWATSQGLVYDSPLDEQIMPNSTCSWQQFFLRSTLEALHENYALYNEAMAQNIPLPDDLLQELEDMPETMRKVAEEAGYTDVVTFVQVQHGVGTTVEEFIQFMRLKYVSDYYFNATMDNLVITDADLEAYMQLLIKEGYTRDETTVYSVRHIHFEVAEDATDEDWKKAEKEARDVLNEWLAGERTEASFSALAMEHSDDPASAMDGGRYQGLQANSTLAEPFVQWYLDSSRQYGDYELIKTEFGYHVMFYIGSQAKWQFECTNGVRNTAAMELVENAKKKHPLTVDYNAIALGVIDPTLSVGG